MFNKTVNLEKNKVIIEVTCEKRTHAMEPKTIFKEKVEDLIPESLRGKVKLVSNPDKILSNMTIPGHSQECTWIFEIIEENKKTTTKSKTTTRRTRSRTKASKST